MPIKLYSECKAETHLMRFLGFKPIHVSVGGIGKVYKKMASEKDLIIGIIDNDIINPNEDDNYQKIQDSAGLAYFKHKEKPQYLVKQEPDFENWIFSLAKKNKLLGKNTKFKSAKDLKVLKRKNAISRDMEIKTILEGIKNLKYSPFVKLRSFVDDPTSI